MEGRPRGARHDGTVTEFVAPLGSVPLWSAATAAASTVSRAATAGRARRRAPGGPARQLVRWPLLRNVGVGGKLDTRAKMH
jgi:hypothetical protein